MTGSDVDILDEGGASGSHGRRIGCRDRMQRQRPDILYMTEGKLWNWGPHNLQRQKGPQIAIFLEETVRP
jgi:hypothetical protein